MAATHSTYSSQCNQPPLNLDPWDLSLNLIAAIPFSLPADVSPESVLPYLDSIETWAGLVELCDSTFDADRHNLKATLDDVAMVRRAIVARDVALFALYDELIEGLKFYFDENLVMYDAENDLEALEAWEAPCAN